MNIDYECINCLLNHSSELMDKINANSSYSSNNIFDNYKRVILKTFGEVNPTHTPYYLVKTFYDAFFDIFGENDYFHSEKADLNQLFLEVYDDLLDFCFSSKDPLYTAFKLSLMGELFCHNSENSFGELEIEIQNFYNTKRVAINDLEKFKKEIKNAHFLLFLHNYAGEIVFDKLFIRVLKELNPNLIIHSALKSRPVYKCATKKDADQIFLKEVSIPFESGSKYLGTDLSFVSRSFKNIYDEADIVIAKGQSNFESLVDENTKKSIYYSFVVKCKKIAKNLDVNKEDLIFKRS
ncbi:hypothetical protein X928_03675 [Petrotoga miotherma DSM 10691]|uniref:Damage-control phosphatase ARMT1-like metal-binding domain-containing protein n=2 Tax=Petrotoga TaxID=28236 RepID=A0A2K1PEB7_9BACT|nr:MULTISPECIES: ARMT1-like domain-containing protein [Petrotoga]MDN5345938.1 damage-control phosphatase, subfamily [Petrotoga sp.]PNS01139.1 hypothetical protein X928_03675 [Petrotoga miotherma DSM 10691]POZ93008.1 hypothetical protein AA81_04175 [Petrotoga halophila DSM 16923]